MKGGKKELVSETPAFNNNNSKPLGKHEEPQAEDTNDTTSNQSQGNTQSTNSSTHDNSHMTSDINTTGDYTEQHPTNDSMTYGQ